MNYTFTIDEDIIRRMMLRQKQDAKSQTRTRRLSLRVSQLLPSESRAGTPLALRKLWD